MGVSPRPIGPGSLRRLWRAMRLRLARVRNRGLSTREVFSRVYRENAWGGGAGEFCSGDGSSERHAAAYAEMVRGFVREKGIARVVDLGCGDHVVGSRILMDGLQYVGVDIVEELVRRNRERYGRSGVTFACLDMIVDELPDGDLCLVRQVLQHLSNAQIGAVLRKVGKYRYVLLTEHYPAPSVAVVPNRDKPHGGDTRIYDDSAVFVDLPPFGVKVSRLMLEVAAGVDLVRPGETLRTFLIEN